MFLDGRFSEAWAVYPWPFANLLTAGFSWLTGLGPEISAHLLAFIWQLVLAWAFLDLLRTLGADRATLIAGGVLFLTLAHFNEYRGFIGRDHGYWALLFTGLALFFRHVERRHWAMAVGAGLAQCLAFLFRVEGAILIVVAPVFLLASRAPWRMRMAGAAWMVLPALVGLLLVWLLYPDREIASLGRMDEWSAHVSHTLDLWRSGFAAKGEALARAILTPWSAQFGLLGVIATLTAIYLVVLIEATGWVASALALYLASTRTLHAQLKNGGLLLGFIMVLLLIPAGFLATQSFITGRHMLTPALLLVVPAAFALAALWQRWAHHRVACGIMAVLLLVTLWDGVGNRSSDKGYIRDAATWARASYGAERLLADQDVLAWYAGAPSLIPGKVQQLATSITRKQRPASFDAPHPALLISVSRKDKTLEPWLRTELGPPVQRFANRKGDAVLVWAPG